MCIKNLSNCLCPFWALSQAFFMQICRGLISIMWTLVPNIPQVWDTYKDVSNQDDNFTALMYET